MLWNPWILDQKDICWPPAVKIKLWGFGARSEGDKSQCSSLLSPISLPVRIKLNRGQLCYGIQTMQTMSMSAPLGNYQNFNKKLEFFERWMKIIYIKTMKTLSLCIIILSCLSIWRGEILRWNLDSGPSQKPASISSAKVLSHNRPVFCMCAGGLNNSLMCTVSMDRQVCLIDDGVSTLHSI